MRILLAAILIVISQLALATKDYAVERAYFEDVTAQLSFDEIKNKDHQSIQEILAKGYSSSVFWVRLKIDGAAVTDASLKDKYGDMLVLRIQPSYLDEIRLYDPSFSVYGEKAVGDKHLLDNNDFSSLNFNLAIPRSKEPRYIWLRVKTTSTSFMRAQVLAYEDFIKLDKVQEFGFSFYLAVLLLLFLFPLLIWLNNKDYLTGVFVIKQLGAISLLIFNAGYLRFLLKDADLDFVQLIVNINLLAYSLITMFFHYVFLNEYDMKKWAKTFFVVAMAAFPVEFLLLVFQLERSALNINMLVLNLMSFSFLIIPAYGINWEKSTHRIFSKKWLIFIHVLIFLTAASTTLPSLGFFQGNQFLAFSGLAYGGITGIIFFIVLQYRYRVAREEGIARVSKAEAYALAEKSRREQQAQFLAMLTHELKTPLSIMKMGYGAKQQSEKIRGHIKTAIDDMTEVIDRCVMDDKLQNHEFKLNIEKCNLNEIVQDRINSFEQERIKFFSDYVHHVKTDVQLFRICLGNLIDNALKYGDVNLPIQVQLSCANQNHLVNISVKNTLGPIGAPDVTKIFDKYYRDPRAYEKTGSGLGLYLVKNFVELLSGKIDCHIDGRNIMFNIYLPALPAHEL